MLQKVTKGATTRTLPLSSQRSAISQSPLRCRQTVPGALNVSTGQFLSLPEHVSATSQSLAFGRHSCTTTCHSEHKEQNKKSSNLALEPEAIDWTHGTAAIANLWSIATERIGDGAAHVCGNTLEGESACARQRQRQRETRKRRNEENKTTTKIDAHNEPPFGRMRQSVVQHEPGMPFSLLPRSQPNSFLDAAQTLPSPHGHVATVR